MTKTKTAKPTTKTKTKTTTKTSAKKPASASEKISVTMRLDSSAIAYFKGLADEMSMPYQTLINLYLRECAAGRLKPQMKWTK
jgi:predicted DNA binding CopG/RHH family protein